MSSKSNRKTKDESNGTDSSIAAILHAFNAFFESESYTTISEIDDADIQDAVSNGSGLVSGSVEEMNRDYFHSPSSLVHELSQFDALKGAVSLLSLGEPDSDGEGYSYQIGVGHLDAPTPWIILLDATIGEYNDTDCDVYGSYEVYVGSKENITREIRSRTERVVTTAIARFNESLQDALSALNLFPEEKAAVEEKMVDDFLKSKIGQTLFPLLEKTVLTKSLPTTETTRDRKVL